MLTIKILFVILLFSFTFGSSLSGEWEHVREKRQRSHPTSFNIELALKRLEGKLIRHEYREAQMADFTMKMLNSLNSGQTDNKKSIHSVAQQLANMEEKMFSLEALITTTDERQRHMIRGMSDGINRLITMSNSNDLLPLPEFGPNPGDGSDFKKIIKKLNSVDDTIQNDIKILNNEVKIVGELFNQGMIQLTSILEDRLLRNYEKSNKEQTKSLSNALGQIARTSKIFVTEMNRVKEIAAGSGSTAECGIAVREIAQKLDSLDAFHRQKTKEMSIVELETQKVLLSQKGDIKSLVKATQAEKDTIDYFINKVVENLEDLRTTSENQLGALEANIKNILSTSADNINTRINNVESTLKLKSTNILDALEDSASQNSNIQDAMQDSFTDLTEEISGLKKVEQVMISTADAVLDTKRSIEFGIKQVIIELSDLVKNSGSTINTTLTDKINDIAISIVKNQTTALTNMTSKLEREISQVWRQIGVMYQQVLQSVVILDELQSTTSNQMNESLYKVDHMDGTVGKINSKVAGVEDDLNYLLGRLTLVVSEFSQMKTGVGDELNRLRDIAKDFSIIEIEEHKLENDESDSEEIDS